MDDTKTSIISENSWRTYLLTLWYPSLMYVLIITMVLWRGQAFVLSPVNAFMVTTGDLPLFLAIALFVFTVGAWFHLHRRVTLSETSIDISSMKLPMSTRRIPLWKLERLLVSETRVENILGLSHVEFFYRADSKSRNDIITGFHREQIDEFVHLANQKIALARTLPHDPIPMDQDMKTRSHRWQKVGYFILVGLVAFFVASLYLISRSQ